MNMAINTPKVDANNILKKLFILNFYYYILNIFMTLQNYKKNHKCPNFFYQKIVMMQLDDYKEKSSYSLFLHYISTTPPVFLH